MCQICTQIQLDGLRAYEVRLALQELASSLPPEHIEEVVELLYKLEQEEENG